MGTTRKDGALLTPVRHMNATYRALEALIALERDASAAGRNVDHLMIATHAAIDAWVEACHPRNVKERDALRHFAWTAKRDSDLRLGEYTILAIQDVRLAKCPHSRAVAWDKVVFGVGRPARAWLDAAKKLLEG
jgi:hypothetical protein